MANIPDKDAYAARSFAAFLGQVEDGQLHDDLTRTLTDLVAALHETAAAGGKPAGSITIAFKLHLDRDVIDVIGDIKVVKPKMARARSIFWATPDNHLTRINPHQRELPFRDVNTKQEVI